MNYSFEATIALQKLSETSQSSPHGADPSMGQQQIEEHRGINSQSIQNGPHIVFCSFKKIFSSVPCHKHVNEWMNACMNKWMNEWMACLTIRTGWKVTKYHCCTCQHHKATKWGEMLVSKLHWKSENLFGFIIRWSLEHGVKQNDEPMNAPSE